MLGLSSLFTCGCFYTKMPGKNYQGELPPLTEQQKILRKELKKHVYQLSEEIGERNLSSYNGLERAADYITGQFKSYGYEVGIQEYSVPAGALRKRWKPSNYEQQKYKNIVAELKGTEKADEIIVIGAHYDSAPVPGCKAANDNASGVAAVLELAKYFSGKPRKRTIRFVAFANEEPPFFWTKYMGSYVYAGECKRKNEKIVGMLTPETIGCYSNEKNSQRYPFPLNMLYPSTGNFIAFVSDSKSKDLTMQSVKIFREHTKFPSEGACLPPSVPMIGASDHWSFWKMGYPALMVTDTAPFRYRYYHTAQDSMENMDFDGMARVVDGLKHVVEGLADTPN
jgi:hypothetical protein